MSNDDERCYECGGTATYHRYAFDPGHAFVSDRLYCTDCGGTGAPGIPCPRCRDQWVIEQRLARKKERRP